ncbi:ABC-type transport auxiliary lipoprotein family protein [Methylocystis sp. WRRC1]|uniref:ABC-type transport auxiliary lipoprotein family protein n=1 Tax=Methylocystis sp. WRRC1 TaxID=1732014 RepID=UPI001D146F52|nr:ABC-type transport auxiliary lipoprotein family protein [Methylocystis sp. WRRC1]MCC3245347.1 ABC-type transport auxiliary lipoprotein family protein [Methylocystis sp. WRRC1]
MARRFGPHVKTGRRGGMEIEGFSTARGGAVGALILFALALAGCAQPPRQTFDLAGAVSAARAAPLRSGPALIVREPAAVQPTGSDRVVVRDVDGSVSVLPGVQWSERLPRLFQNRLIEAMQRAGVPAGQISLGATAALATDIRRFEIDVARSIAVVEIEARLVSESNGATRAAQLFTAEAPAPEHTGAPAVHALGEASATVAARIAAWARGRM